MLNEEPRPVDDFPILAEETSDALDDRHARARTDYETWKRELLEWLYYEGRNPARQRGYADHTIRATTYKVDQIMRWLWNQRGYTTELTPDDADELMKQLARYSDSGDANLNTFVKVLKRIFKFYNHERGKNIEWDCDIELNEPNVTNRDYFYKEEFRQLYEAALGYGTVRHYNACTPAERDAIKAHLAQRFEKPKDEITPDDFQKANTFKIPSLVSVSLDCGLRPIEVERAKTDWINFNDRTLDIPKEDSSKNEDNWKCVLSDKSIRALDTWMEERDLYDRYNGTDALWLNKRGNPYNSNSLNTILTHIKAEAGVEPAGRDLTWYSIRHGVATVWVDEENLHDAREQLRHKKIETTLGYAHSNHRNRQDVINSKW